MASLFKDVKPPFGKYYISGSGNNCIITVFDTKVVFESLYNNKYTFTELTNPPTSLKDKGYDGSYTFTPVNIGFYNITITIFYAPSVRGLELPYITILYQNISTSRIDNFESVKGVNQNPPPWFIQPSPITTQPPIQPSPITHSPITPSPITSTPTTKSFFNEYFIYIGIVIFFMIISIGAYFFIINRKPTIQTISKNK